GNIDEKVRHANTKLADLHLVASEDARERVIKMGEEPGTVINTGCPSLDLAKTVKDNPVLDFDPIEKYGGVGPQVDWQSGYIVAMQHPETNRYKQAKADVHQTLKAIDELNIPTFWFWPNVDSGADGTSNAIRSFREINKPENIHFFKNMEPLDFLKLLVNSKGLVGNSSAGIRECAYLGVPVVNIGKRQNRRERAANVLDVDYNSEEIKNAILKQIEAKSYPSESIYGDGEAGLRIAKILAEAELNYFKTITY
ncbi:MAG: UDP-N-acetylglucosamine 2-epimerase, partial [Leeuwenhoekiella sp.]